MGKKIYPPLLAVFVASLGVSCIPSTPPETPPANATAPTATTPQSSPAPPEGQSGLTVNVGGAGIPNAGIRVVKQDNGNFTVEGQFGPGGAAKLIGEIRPEPEGKWKLDAKLHVPTGGYTVGEPYAVPMSTMVIGDGNPQIQEGGNTVIISLPVSAPEPDAMLTQAVEEKPVALVFDAPKDPQFTLLFVSS